MAILAGFPPSNTISPSVRITETDLSMVPTATTTYNAGLVGFCSKGPINIPTNVTSILDLHTTFGYPHPDQSDPYLIYAAEQFLLIASTLYIVRVADESPVSPTQALTASLQVPGSGTVPYLAALAPSGNLTGTYSATINGTYYNIVNGAAYYIPNNAGVTAASYSNPSSSITTSDAYTAYYFRWRLNGNLSSKTLVLLPGTYTAVQLADPTNAYSLASQVNPAIDGIEFVTYDQISGTSPTNNPTQYAIDVSRLVVRAYWAYGSDASLELVSVQNALYGGPQNGLDHWVDITPGLGSWSPTYSYTAVPHNIGNGVVQWYLPTDTGFTSPLGVLVNGVYTLRSNVLNPIGFGTGMTNARLVGTAAKYPASTYNIAGNYDLSSGGATGLTLNVIMEGTDNVLIDDIVQTISFPNFGVNTNISTIVQQINQYAHGFFAYDLSGALALSTDTFGEDSKLFVRSDSTADTIFGLANVTTQGGSPAGTSGDSNIYYDAIVNGSGATNQGLPGLAGIGTSFTLTADSPGIEGNNTQVVITNNQYNGTFNMIVYSYGAQVEQWGGLTKNTASSYYVESYLSLVSNYIRVNDNVSNPAGPLAGTYTLGSGTNSVAGTDGIPVDPDDQDALIIGLDIGMTGMYAMSDTEQIDIDLIAAPGRASTDVVLALINFSQSVRMDCFSVIDPPFGLTVTEIVAWQNGAHPLNLTRFDSDFGALYWPWLNYTDTTNQINVWVPPSGSVLGVYANNDNIAAPWFAPAGLNRGIVNGINDVFQRPSLSERDLMYGNANAVNPIIQFPDIGNFVVFGQKTLQRAPTALNRVNVRRMMLYIEKAIKLQSRYLLFEPNDTTLWQEFIQLATNVLEEVKSKRGITDYVVQCDSTTNTADSIDRNELHARIGIVPTYAVEFIYINFSLFSNASFNSPANTF